MAAETNIKKLTRKEILQQYHKKTQFQEIVGRFIKNKLAIAGMIGFAIVLILCLGADLISNYEENALKMDVKVRLQGPSWEHPFGTDEMGRDIFSRVIHGSRYSLSIAAVACSSALIAGGAFGAAAGYFGGKTDMIIMRVCDVFLCLPQILLAIAIVAAFGTGTDKLIIAIAISRVPGFARIVRTAVLQVRNMEYVEAAKAIGANNFIIITQHVLVNCMAYIIVQVTLSFASSILGISSLSFLGLGIQPPTPEWGNMLSSGRGQMRDYPHLVMAPGLAIFVTILSLNLLGDGLRDALDPRLKK